MQDEFGFQYDEETQKIWLEKEETSTSRAKEQKARWREVLQIYNNDLDSIPWGSLQIRSLIRYGIPTLRARSKIWELLLRVEETETQYPSDYYPTLCQRADSVSSESDSPYLKYIMNDLSRSLPKNIKFQTDEGKLQLKRLLLAYSWHNPEVGYCQGLNLIAASLLLFYDPEPAFWVLCCIIEKYMSDYFQSTAIIGSLVEQAVFQEVFRQRFPLVDKFLDDLSIPLFTVCGQWFMVLYIHVLPWETTFRVWDILFSEGKDILLSVGLAIFHMCGSDVLSCEGPNQVFQVVNDQCKNLHDPDPLIECACREYLLDHDSMQHLRAEKKKELEQVMCQLSKSASTSNSTPTKTQNRHRFHDSPSFFLDVGHKIAHLAKSTSSAASTFVNPLKREHRIHSHPVGTFDFRSLNAESIRDTGYSLHEDL